MAETDLTLAVVACRVGLKTAAHLSVIFKKQTGQTPGEYRKEAQG